MWASGPRPRIRGTSGWRRSLGSPCRCVIPSMARRSIPRSGITTPSPPAVHPIRAGSASTSLSQRVASSGGAAHRRARRRSLLNLGERREYLQLDYAIQKPFQLEEMRDRLAGELLGEPAKLVARELPSALIELERALHQALRLRIGEIVILADVVMNQLHPLVIQLGGLGFVLPVHRPEDVGLGIGQGQRAPEDRGL